MKTQTLMQVFVVNGCSVMQDKCMERLLGAGGGGVQCVPVHALLQQARGGGDRSLMHLAGGSEHGKSAGLTLLIAVPVKSQVCACLLHSASCNGGVMFCECTPKTRMQTSMSSNKINASEGKSPRDDAANGCTENTCRREQQQQLHVCVSI